MSGTRIETDSMGEVVVAADRYWGAQTQRSLENFKIGGHRFPPSIIRAFGVVKKASALANLQLGKLDAVKCDLIVRAGKRRIRPAVPRNRIDTDRSDCAMDDVAVNGRHARVQSTVQVDQRSSRHLEAVRTRRLCHRRRSG